MEAIKANIPQITEFVNTELDRLGCSIKAQMAIDIAIDEMLANISSYAYAAGKGTVEVRVDFDEENRTVAITFMDRGIPFDPLQRKEPDTSLPAEEREIGGLGIFLVRKTMDAMEYRRENGTNILTIRKKIR